VIGTITYVLLIFFFTYWYTAVQFNVEDIADNLKRSNSYIPGVRPGKQTVDFLNGVITRLTTVGAAFLAFVALSVYLVPLLTQINTGLASLLLGTSLLIIVQVALETMRQIEANLMMKQYGS
jgi:preprotein translocase subunit SecY